MNRRTPKEATRHQHINVHNHYPHKQHYTFLSTPFRLSRTIKNKFPPFLLTEQIPPLLSPPGFHSPSTGIPTLPSRHNPKTRHQKEIIDELLLVKNGAHGNGVVAHFGKWEEVEPAVVDGEELKRGRAERKGEVWSCGWGLGGRVFDASHLEDAGV
jgi:hypothetical protein